MIKRSAALATTMVAIALTVTACGGDGHTTGVASLSDSHTTTTIKKSTKANKQAFQDAALAFARCMREHGVDMPDPSFSDNGGMTIKSQAAPDAGGGPTNATFDTAQKACQPIMDKAEQDMPRPSPAELAKMHDEALAFSRCMRQHGIDMPDPTFDSNGGAKIELHGGSSNDGGSSPGAVVNGNPANPSPPKSDPKFETAAKACGGPGTVTKKASK
jgi:hypothetical protein